MDGRVMDVPYPIRFAIVYGFILPFRPRASAEAYSKVWTGDGSPLVLFPHYAMSSYESAVERVKEVAAKTAPHLQLSILPPYYNREEYIGALAATASHYLEKGYDHLLFSFHGIPERHLLKANPGCGDCLKGTGGCDPGPLAAQTCYRYHCLETVRRFAVEAGLKSGSFSFAFQSRLGMDAWLAPATHEELTRLAQSGVRKLLVICPAFTVDCLETIEEIGMRGKEAFLEAGGRQFTMIPCLNDHPAWVDALARMTAYHAATNRAAQ